MKERPIIFNGEMVRAILDGCKTQTRRVVNPQPVCMNDDFDGTWDWKDMGHYYDDLTLAHEALKPCCPYGQKGDRLWVRETWMPETEQGISTGGIIYRASRNLPEPDGESPLRWRPSFFMKRSDSRITLEITEVRVERVNEISHLDALAEGIDTNAEPNDYGSGSRYRDTFAALWDSINAKRGRGWNTNPWVFVLEFRRMDA